jgi:hypothetical protein
MNQLVPISPPIVPALVAIAGYFRAADYGDSI